MNVISEPDDLVEICCGDIITGIDTQLNELTQNVEELVEECKKLKMETN